MIANFETKKLKFKKKGTNEQFDIDFQTNPTDPLHPCVLFYYENDEVEFLPDYKDWWWICVLTNAVGFAAM